MGIQADPISSTKRLRARRPAASHVAEVYRNWERIVVYVVIC